MRRALIALLLAGVIVADRLAQPMGQWKPFERNSRLMRMVYPDIER